MGAAGTGTLVFLGIIGAGALAIWALDEQPVKRATHAPHPKSELEPESYGPEFNPRKPYALGEYVSGGGHVKSVDFFATKSQADDALLSSVQDEDEPVRYRHVFRVVKLTSQAHMDRFLNHSMSRKSYASLARRQARSG